MAARDLVQAGVRESTSKAYSPAQRSFLHFCEHSTLTPMPVTEETVLLFVAYLHTKHVLSSSLNVYLSAIRSLHIMNGLQEPPTRTPRVKLALKAISNSAPP